MASKSKFFDLILAKGEKVTVFVAGALLVALLLWGAITAFGGESPSATAKTISNETQRVVSATSNSNNKPPEIEPRFHVDGALAVNVPAEEFRGKGDLFEPTIEPSRLRELPKVLTPEGFAQIDLIKGPMPSFDIVDD